jgi:hypothetical protein
MVMICKHCGKKLANGQKLARHRQLCAKFLQAQYFSSASVESIEKLIAKGFDTIKSKEGVK